MLRLQHLQRVRKMHQLVGLKMPLVVPKTQQAQRQWHRAAELRMYHQPALRMLLAQPQRVAGLKTQPPEGQRMLLAERRAATNQLEQAVVPISHTLLLSNNLKDKHYFWKQET